jgi:pimeloyl-ACP methyl ester carboxylesterase
MSSDVVVQNGDVALAVRDYGGVGRFIVLVHGGPGQNLATWDDFAPLLSVDLHPVALDMRGNGSSDDASDYSWPALASDIHAVIVHFGMVRPLLVGHSWGGQLVTYYASQYQDCGGVIGIDGWITDVRTELGDEVWEWIAESYAADEFLRFPGTREQLAPILAHIAREHGSAAAAVTERQLIADPDGLLRWRRTVEEIVHIQRTIDRAGIVLNTGLYDDIRCPILLIGGSRSEEEVQALREGRLGPWAFSRTATEPITERYALVALAWLPCGHDIPHEMPAELASRIKSFAASLG